MAENTKQKKNVIIMGGGLAGLAAGLELAKKGYQVIVLEKEGQVGGLAKTFEVNNFRFDTGPHRWYAKNDKINRWMLDFLGKEIVSVSRLTRIYFDKKFFYYPIRLKNALLGIGFVKAVRSVIDYAIARINARLGSPKARTMEDGYINQFGKTLYETFFKRYSEKLWGVSCDKISIDWVGQRTRGLNILTVLKDALFKSKNVVSLVDKFSYPKKGIGRLSEKLATEIIKKGGQIQLNSTVTTINHDNSKIRSIQAVEDGKKKQYKASKYISTIALNDLVLGLTPKVPEKVFKKAKKLTYRDELQVSLFVKKTHITPDTWIYVHPKKIPFMRVMEMDNWTKSLSPKGATTLVFEIPCSKGKGIWNKKDQQIIDLVLKSYMEEFALLKKKDIIDGFVYRAEKEYPVYHLGYKKDLKEIKNYLKKFNNLQIAGRNGVFRYNNMDHSIEMGLYAAKNIIEGGKKYDIESVNIEREYLEEKKIQD